MEYLPRTLSARLSYLLSVLVAISLWSCGGDDLPHIAIQTQKEIIFDKRISTTIGYEEGGNTIDLEGKIKARGGYSRKFAKRSYALELVESHPLAGLPSDDDWVLNASYIDKTFMRHRLSFDLFRDMAERNIAPQCSYLTLSTNGVQKGLYVAMQKVNAGLVDTYYPDSLVGLWKEPPVFYKDRLTQPQESQNYYQQKYPKLKVQDRSALMDSLHQFLHQSSDEQFMKQIAAVFDLDQVIDWHLLLLLSNNSDGLLKNFYLYKSLGSVGYRLAIWDYDHSFGRDGDNELNMMARPIDINRCVLLRRLAALYPEYEDRLQRRYTYLRQTKIWSTSRLHSMIDSYHAQIEHSVKKNEQLWPTHSKDYFDDNEYTDEVEILKNYIPLRLGQLDRQFGYEEKD